MRFGSLEPAIAYAVEFAGASGLKNADYTDRVMQDDVAAAACRNQ
jgi:hypothetical protein